MRAKGKLTFWNDKKGFGFISPAAGGKQIFVHIKAFSNRGRRPELNQFVTYAVSTDKQGRPCAINATLAGDQLPEKTKLKNGSLAIAVAFLTIVGVSAFTARIPPLIFGLYLIASIVAFIMYAFDKSAAKKGAWRTQESTLHLLSLAGGWPGALIAQDKLRHKSRKQSFRFVFWVTVLLNCGICMAVYSNRCRCTAIFYLQHFIRQLNACVGTKIIYAAAALVVELGRYSTSRNEHVR